MPSKSLTKHVAVALGCAGAAVTVPFLAPYLATVSLPYFGAVLAGVFKADQFTDGFGKVIVNTAIGFLTEIGGAAIDKISLGSEHNYHLEKMLATAYLESLEAIEKEIEVSEDEELKEQAEQIFPPIKARLEKGLKKNEPSLLFPLQTADQLADTAFANRLSAEKVSLLIVNEERWHEQMGDEVEISLRRWLIEERAAAERAAQRTQLGLATDAWLPEPLRLRLREKLPHGIAHRISELVKRNDFKESWIAFQRAHLQGILRVVERIETSQADVKQCVDALAQRIEGFANRDELVAALAEKLQVFLSQTYLPSDALARLLEQQSAELRGFEERLGAKIDQSTERLSIEGQRNTTHLSDQIESLDKKVEEAILQGAVRAARNRLNQLTAPLRDFTGREAELEELRQALRHGGATISGVQGMGGVGKTELALRLADEFKDLYPDAQIYLDLKGVSKQPLSPAEVMWHVISSFQSEMKRLADADLPAWYNALLNDNRVLLFYDNARDAAQIESLLPPTHCLLLVTSRKHFRLPGMFDKNLNKMSEADAEAMLLEIAPRIAADAVAIAKQCDYLPLALRLAASALHKSHALDPSDLLRRLQDKRRRVELVEASFSLSYELLTEELQKRWLILAIFTTDFDAPAAAALWQTDVDGAKDSLAELEEHSLLGWEEAARRYRWHDLARDFADLRLSTTEREQAGLLHAEHYLKILSAANDLYLKGGEAIAEGLSLFDNERINIEDGQEWVSLRIENDERNARLCLGFAIKGPRILNLRQHPKELIRWREIALRVAQEFGDRQNESVILRNIGLAYEKAGEFRKALTYNEQSLAISRELGDKLGESANLGNMGIAYRRLCEFSKALHCHTVALAISREIDDKPGEAIDLGSLGLVQMAVGEVQSAIEYYQQALTISRDWGDLRNAGIWLGSLGIAYANRHETHTAIDYFEQALSIAREINDRTNEGYWLGNLGLVYADLDKVSTAIDYYQQAIAIAHETGDKLGEGNWLSTLGIAYSNFGEIKKAIEFMEIALKILEEIESPNAKTARGRLEEMRSTNR